MVTAADVVAGARTPTAARDARRGFVSGWVHGPLAVVLVGVLVGVRRAERPYADGDILWGVRTGLDLMRTWRLPHGDPYSWTAHGHAWVQNSWGWNLVLGVAYRLGGLAGVAVLGVLGCAAVAFLLGLLARRAGLFTPMVAWVLLALGSLLSIFFNARAQIVDYAAVPALLLLVPVALTAPRRAAVRAGAGVAAVQVVWMNLHTSALLAPLLVLAIGAGRMLMTRPLRRSLARRTLVLTVVAALGCLATPYATATITHATEVRSASVGLISEWLPVGFGQPIQILAFVTLCFGALAAFSAWRRREFDLLAVLALLGVATASAARFAPLLAVVAVLPIAALAMRIPARPAIVTRLWALSCVVAAISAATGVSSFGAPGSMAYSPRLVAQLPSGCRLLNDLNIGGNVMLQRPDVPVSLDSRNDLYGRALELESLRVLADPATGRAYVTAHHVTCVLANSAEPLVRALATDPAWRVVDSDSERTVLVRR